MSCWKSKVNETQCAFQNIAYRVGLVRAPCCAVVLPQEAPSGTSRFHTRAHQFAVASALEMHAGWKLSRDCEHRRPSTSTLSLERTKTTCFPQCVCIRIKFSRRFEGRGACGGKHEDNRRLPWMMMSHNERRLVIHAFCSCRESSDQTLHVLQQTKRCVCLYVHVWGVRAVLISCNLLILSENIFPLFIFHIFYWQIGFQSKVMHSVVEHEISSLFYRIS